jgi:hypothetical protein
LEKLSRVDYAVLRKVERYAERGADLSSQAGETIRDSSGRTKIAENDGPLARAAVRRG